MTRTVYIYTLKDPRDNKVCYVGRTVNLDNRFNQHMHDHPYHYGRFRRWRDKLKSEGLVPVMSIIDECDSELAKNREMFWIGRFSEISPLVNVQYPPNEELEHVGSRVTKNQLKALMQVKLDTGLSISEIIRRALDKYLEDVKNGRI